MPRTIRTPNKRKAFLKVLAQGRSVAAAAKAAGMGRTAAFAWKRDDAQFAAEWEDAYDAGTDAFEDEALCRALDGSDKLLMFLLKRRRPEKYLQRAVAEKCPDPTR
jgi:Bacteriophage Sf6, terminase small subunit-like